MSQAAPGQKLNEVICRAEFLSYRQTKLIVTGTWVTTLLGFAGVITLAVYKAQANSNAVFSGNALPAANIAVYTFSLACVLCCLAIFVYHLRMTKHNKWDVLRYKIVFTNMLLSVVLTVELIIAITANSLVIQKSCWWLNPPSTALITLDFLSYTCYNLYFVILLIQVHSLCPQTRVIYLLEERFRAFFHQMTKMLHVPRITCCWVPDIVVDEVCAANASMVMARTPSATRRGNRSSAATEALTQQGSWDKAQVLLLHEDTADKQGGKDIGCNGADVATECANGVAWPHAEAKDDKLQPLQFDSPASQPPPKHTQQDGAVALDVPTLEHGAKVQQHNGDARADVSLKQESGAGEQSAYGPHERTWWLWPPSMTNNQLPPTSIGADWSCVRHWHIALLFVVLQGALIGKYISTLNATDYPPTPGDGQYWNTTSEAIEDFVRYFAESSRPIWEQMAQDGQPPLPHNISVATGNQLAESSWIMLFGPSGTYTLNEFLTGFNLSFSDRFAYGERVDYQLVQPEYIDNATFAFWVVEAWLKVLSQPWFGFCVNNRAFPYSQVEEAVQANSAAFREHFGLPACDTYDVPDWDISCNVRLCPIQTSGLGWMLTLNIAYYMYAALYLWHLYRAVANLRRYSYTKYRLANIWVRLLIREGLVVTIATIISVTMLSYINRNQCSSAIIATLGVSPVSFMFAVLAICVAWYSSPISHAPEVMLHEQRQVFAWLESDVPGEMKQRGCLEEPMFCFETALKCLVWSICIYRETADEPEQIFTLKNAMVLDGLTEYQYVLHPEHDFAMVAAWGPGCILLSFRGTASMRNVAVDMKAWQAKHPAMTSKSPILGPAVHKGFLSAWLSAKDEVLQLVTSLLDKGITPDCCGKIWIVMTGHSLGGALAELASWDVHLMLQERKDPRLHLQIYTYGAPHVGNHAWARQYKAQVKDCWEVVNRADVIPRATKWMRVYKRAGKRVLINNNGDLLCRPSWIEMSIKMNSLNSIDDHMLASYCGAFAAVAAAQYSRRRCIPGGAQGVSRLWDHPHSRQLMEWISGSSFVEFHDDIRELQEKENKPQAMTVRQAVQDAVQTGRNTVTRGFQWLHLTLICRHQRDGPTTRLDADINANKLRRQAAKDQKEDNNKHVVHSVGQVVADVANLPKEVVMAVKEGAGSNQKKAPERLDSSSRVSLRPGRSMRGSLASLHDSEMEGSQAAVGPQESWSAAASRTEACPSAGDAHAPSSNV